MCHNNNAEQNGVYTQYSYVPEFQNPICIHSEWIFWNFDQVPSAGILGFWNGIEASSVLSTAHSAQEVLLCSGSVPEPDLLRCPFVHHFHKSHESNFAVFWGFLVKSRNPGPAAT
jgi:hypothetical protein